MKLELVSVDGQRPPVILRQLPVIVGLDRSADLCLDDSAVGHYQCMIDESDGVLMVWDLGTKLGTMINGVRIARKAPLQPGDELAIGKNRFIANYGAPSGSAGNRAQKAVHRRREPAAQT